jgi:hypothetical protein
MLTLTNKRLLDIEKGFTLLLPKTFPNATARQRATFQYSTLQPMLTAYRDGLKPLAERDVPTLSPKERDALQREFDEYMNAEVEVPPPTKQLVDADLPKDKDGDANGVITALLAPEFFTLVDPDSGDA